MASTTDYPLFVTPGRWAAAAIVLALACAGAARARWANLAVMVFSLDPQGSRLTLTRPGELIPEGDANGDGRVRPEAVAGRAKRIATALAGRLALRAPGPPPVAFRVEGAGPPRMDTRVDPRVATDVPGESHVELRLAFAPAPTADLRPRYELFAANDPHASCLATVHPIGVPSISHVFTPAHRRLPVKLVQFAARTQDQVPTLCAVDLSRMGHLGRAVSELASRALDLCIIANEHAPRLPRAHGLGVNLIFNFDEASSHHR